MVRNSMVSETELITSTVETLHARLPSDWHVTLVTAPRGQRRPDACMHLAGPDGAMATVAVKVISARTASYLRYVIEIMRRVRDELPDVELLAVAPYFSPSIRDGLTKRGIGYADATGNVRLAIARPALFLETVGASRDPWPDDQPLRSLRGSAAGRAVRAFCDFAPPYGTRELADRASVPAPTLSRVAELLERDGILTRERPRGRIAAVDWQAALRRWAQDYQFAGSNKTSMWLEPRGLPALLAKLPEAGIRSAITGSLAATVLAPITVPRLAAVYVDDAQTAAKRLGLRPAESGANVLLAVPFDQVVFARGFSRDGQSYAAYSQIAVDLLTGPGRSPAEGEAILQWMTANERVWRT